MSEDIKEALIDNIKARFQDCNAYIEKASEDLENIDVFLVELSDHIGDYRHNKCEVFELLDTLEDCKEKDKLIEEFKDIKEKGEDLYGRIDEICADDLY